MLGPYGFRSISIKKMVRWKRTLRLWIMTSMVCQPYGGVLMTRQVLISFEKEMKTVGAKHFIKRLDNCGVGEMLCPLLEGVTK